MNVFPASAISSKSTPKLCSSPSTPRRLCLDQPNVKTTPGPPRGVMVPLVLLVYPNPPCSTFSVKFQKVWIRMDRSGPGRPQGPQPPLVDQEHSRPPCTMLRHFPDVFSQMPQTFCPLNLLLSSIPNPSPSLDALRSAWASHRPPNTFSCLLHLHLPAAPLICIC